MPRLIVLGAGQGGLSAAIHARLAGWEVLVLERHTGAGGKARAHDEQGFRFDLGPSIIILTEVYEQVFRAAGRRMEDYLRFRRLDTLSRVFFEGADPVDIPADADRCLDWIRARAPRDAASLDRLLNDLDDVAPGIERTIFAHSFDRPVQLLNRDLARFALRFPFRKTYREIVDSWIEDPLLRALFYGFPSYGGQSYDARSPSGFMIPYYMLRRGVWWPEGGVSAIPEAFARLARELGVEFSFGAEVTTGRVEGNRLASVRTSSGEEFTADAFISNIDRQTMRSVLFGKPKQPPSYSYFTIHWGISKWITGLEHHNLVVPKRFAEGFDAIYQRREFPTEPIVYINHCGATDPSFVPEGGTDLFAVVTTPGIEPQLDWTRDQNLYEQRVRKALLRAGIEWEPGQESVKIVQTPETFQMRDGNAGGSLYGPDERYRHWGLFPSPNRDPDLRNLAYCGGSVQPGAGLPMVTLSGRFAVESLISSGCRPKGSS